MAANREDTQGTLGIGAVMMQPFFSTYYTVLYYTLLYCAILYFTILCYTIHYTLLYCAILYFTILCYTLLYCAILYYTLLIGMSADSPQCQRMTYTLRKTGSKGVLWGNPKSETLLSSLPSVIDSHTNKHFARQRTIRALLWIQTVPIVHFVFRVRCDSKSNCRESVEEA